MAKNIVYCDYLEHLYLHILICEYPSPEKNEQEAVGIGGVINFLAPELNDFYSGWIPNQEWKRICLNLVKDDKETYLLLLKRFKDTCHDYPLYTDKCLLKSFNAPFGQWSRKNNNAIFQEIEKEIEKL